MAITNPALDSRWLGLQLCIDNYNKTMPYACQALFIDEDRTRIHDCLYESADRLLLELF